MTEFILFRHKSNGEVRSYPEHYIDHPVFGEDLEVYYPEEYEEDKVVDESHELPVEQRARRVATKAKTDDTASVETGPIELVPALPAPADTEKNEEN